MRVEASQLSGNCFAFYVRCQGMWNGLRRIYHIHDGPCRSDCEPNCQGYNEQAAVLVCLLAEWLEQASPYILPQHFKRRPLDAIVAEIAQGIHSRVRKSKRRGNTK